MELVSRLWDVVIGGQSRVQLLKSYTVYAMYTLYAFQLAVLDRNFDTLDYRY